MIALLLCIARFTFADRPAERELRFWINTRDRGIEAALRAFERQNPGVRIVVSLYRDGRESQKLMTAIAGGDPPDVVIQDRFTVGEWASRGAFLALDDLIAATGQTDRPLDPDDFYHTCLAEAMYDGRIYAIPYNTDVRALYYNESLLRKAGLVDADGNVVPPRDWDELREYAIKLTERDATGRLVTLGFAPNWGNSWLYLYGWLNGGRFMSDDGRTVLLNEPAIVEALAYMDGLYRAVGGVQAVDAFIGSASGAEFDPFVTGRVAMVINGDWYTNVITQYHPSLPFRVAAPPAPRGRTSVTWSGGFSYVIPTTSGQPELAFELIRYLVSDEGFGVINEVNAQYAASRGRAYVPQMSAQPKVNEWVFERYMMNDPRIPDRVKAAQPLFRSLMTVSRFRPVTPVGQLLWDEHVRAIEEVVRGGRDPQVVLDIATAKVQRRLDELLDDRAGTAVNWRPILLTSSVGVVVLLGGAIAVVLRRSARSHHGAEARAALVFVSPWVIGFLGFTLGPVL
ncbi:MAG TPA: ABC transporter substrate-binding protein, partial [Tepidisphaeraceae bacterium]|nr:ABC transporter substrate-binding protein [Tepidisphaeraceae bacterium]